MAVKENMIRGSLNQAGRGGSVFHDTDDGVLNVTFGEFYEMYAADKGPRLKQSTWAFKKAVICSKLVPYFGDMALKDIGPQDVLRWQNAMMSQRDSKGKLYSSDYLRDAHAQLSAIFNHAVRYYGLERNPASVVGTFQKGAPHEMRYWTKEEYFRFAEQMRSELVYYYAFEVLYWTGMREGELLALTTQDIDLPTKTLTINKTYHRMDGRDVVTSPKTTKSNRKIMLPSFLCEELQTYMGKIRPLLRRCPDGELYNVRLSGQRMDGDWEEACPPEEERSSGSDDKPGQSGAPKGQPSDVKSDETQQEEESTDGKSHKAQQERMRSTGNDWEMNRLFPISSYLLRTALNHGADLAGVKRIRVHDLRHSHVSLLINNGFSALAIGERVGHEAEKITYRYAHLFSTVQNQMVDLLDNVHQAPFQPPIQNRTEMEVNTRLRSGTGQNWR